MNVISTSTSKLSTRRLDIGFEGENERTQVRIDATKEFTEYPQASPTLAVKPGFGEEVYPVIVTKEGNEVVWLVTQNNLDFTGDGEIQLNFVKDSVICKTVIGKIHVDRSLIVNTDPPEHIDTWYDAATAKLADVDEAVNALEAIDAIAYGLPAGSDPTVTLRYVEALGHKRFTFQIPKGNSGERGATGNGIRSISQSGSTGLYKKYTIHFTDGNTTTFQVRDGDRGLKGDTGATPDIGIGTVETLPAGSEATASMSGTAENPLLNLGIPKGDTGEKGDKGDKGDRGATPIFSMGAVTNLPAGTSATATITGTAEEPVLNLGIPKGDKGDKGDRGERGPQGIQGIQGDRGLTGPKGKKGDKGDKGDTGATGATGATPDFSIGTVSTLPAGSSATAEITGTAENPVLSFGIPQGAQGIQGEQGAKGEKGDPGEVTTEQMDAAIDEALQDYARTDGYYPDMTVGNAEQLNSSKYVENSEPYTFRTSGGASDIGNREYLDAVVGGTLAWNQAVRDEASENQTDFAPIVTVTDAVEDAAGVKVQIEPVQDLHGYDHPWPAGGGKNKFGFEEYLEATNTPYTKTGNTYTVTIPPGTTLFTNPWVFSDTNIPVTLSCASFTAGTATNPRIDLLDTNGSIVAQINTATFSISGNGCTARMNWSTGGTFTISEPMVELGSTKTAFVPYSNICPITGWDGVKVTRTGKNLLNKAAGIVFDIPRFIKFGVNQYSDTVPNKTLKLIAGTYTFSVSGANSTNYEAFAIFDESNTRVVISYNAKGITFTLTKTGFYYITMAVRAEEFTSWDNYDLMLELGSTATDYEPYAGNTYDITLPTEAGTVYGGELTVNADGSGSLVVDSIVYDISADTGWARENRSSSVGGYYFDKRFDSNIPLFIASQYGASTLVEKYSAGIIRNPYDNIGNYAWAYRLSDPYGFIRIGFSDEMGIDTVEKFNEWRANNTVQIYYPLLNSTTYTLTASQIRTLLGTNNVWADTGDLALTYTGTDEHLTLESGKKYLSRISGTDSMLLGSGQEITAAKGTDNVFDLTQMFGTAVADYVYGQGAAFFRKWFSKQWYPYNAGELRHVEGLSAHDMVGFNQWDEDWEVGIISWAGDNAESPDPKIRSKGYIPVLPNTTYTVTTTANLQFFYYDSEKVFISYEGSSIGNRVGFTTPANCCYVRFYTYYNYGTTYNHDICISLIHNGSRKGEYAPYEKHSYPLDSSVILRGIPKVGANGVYWDGDRYLPDGTVERRYKEILIDESRQWYKDADANGYSRYYFEDDTIKRYLGYIGLIPNSKGYENANDHVFSTATNDIAVSLYNTTYNIGRNWFYIGFKTSMGISTVDALKTWLASNNFTVVVELATPTIETAQPYHSTQWVSDWGTEEFVSTGLVPVGTETRYPANLRDKLQHLPDAASGNGSYLITQTDGQMVLTPFPAPPSTAGNYILKATVTNGVATYTWEVAT